MGKRCPGCGETKPASAYSRDKGRSDGLRSYCRSCCAAQERARREARLPPEHARLNRLPRACVCCGAPYSMRKGEAYLHYAMRDTCGNACAKEISRTRRRATLAARAEQRRAQVRQYLLEHPGAKTAEVCAALRAGTSHVSAVRAELRPPTPAPAKVAAAKRLPAKDRAPALPKHAAIVPSRDITARQIAEYLQAGAAARRLFDPAIAQAAAELGVAP